MCAIDVKEQVGLDYLGRDLKTSVAAAVQQ